MKDNDIGKIRNVGINKFRHDLSLKAATAIDLFMMAGAFFFCWFKYYAKNEASPYTQWENWCMVALFLASYIALARTYDAFMLPIMKISELFYSHVLALLFSEVFLYIVAGLVNGRPVRVMPLAACFVIQAFIAGIWCVAAHRWYFAVYPPKRSAIVYGDREGLEMLVRQYGLEKKFKIEFTVDIEKCLEDLTVLDGLEAVFFSGVHSASRNVALKYCVANDIDSYTIPRIGDLLMSSANQMHMFHLPMLRVRRYSPSPFYLFAKRAFDIITSGLALIVASPVFLITAIAIKIDDPGPVFYTQERLTKDGKVFKIHKFRSMRTDAEKDGVARLSTGDSDPRITRVGRIIRKCRIDELPQLIDILCGNLSVVGPRPERPSIAAEYEKEMPEFSLRLQAKAGLTGYAQVYGKYNTTPYDKLQMDLMYIANPSLVEDLRICFATVKILFMAESTEGVEEGAVTAMRGQNGEDKVSA